MSIFKKAFILSAVALVVCAFSSSKATKRTFVAKNVVESVLGENSLSCQRDW
ncbi:hypothetical protein NF27_DT00970 [Candidatus Jidaibacter acanthamoeba]|uniref:Secreted protein n=1 Tax=Candidatus Jidaibacter acanthamoebae TaxID=86105 RepID=A0A0C1QMQ1_9RICK|nr:hypothetical protein [Candidatus Jidaibacter acanthamoeba]KIE05323.1 hypothetical protein NF27_DT00970 [Candidatus Jidaibacter acanthamoeba]